MTPDQCHAHRARPARRGAVPARRRARTAPGTATASTAARARAGSTPDSPIARVHGDASMFVGGIRALLLQTLHPAAMRGGLRALRLPRRHVGPARPHQPLPGRHHVRHRRRRPAGRRRGARRSTSGSPARCPTARRTPPPTRTCWPGCTSPRSTASCAPTRSTARQPLDQAGRDEYVAQTAEVARRLGVLDPPTTEAELARGARGVPPRAARHARGPRGGRATCCFRPPLPLAARAPYGVLVAAAVGADAALDPAAAAAAVAAGLRAHRGPGARRRSPPARSAGR